MSEPTATEMQTETILSMQEGLNALLDRIQEVQHDHEKIEEEKKLLEDYYVHCIQSVKGNQ